MSRWGNEGQCTPTFTEEEKDDINGTYRQMFETMADLSYERINDLKNKKVWYEWAKETDQKDLMAPGPIGPVTNAQIESSAPAIQPTIKSYERPSSPVRSAKPSPAGSKRVRVWIPTSSSVSSPVASSVAWHCSA